MAWLKGRGALVPGCRIRGASFWSRGGEPSGSIDWSVDLEVPNAPHLALDYATAKDGIPIHDEIPLVTTRPNYGGTRWWFVCWCGRLCGAVYLPSGATRFRCRHCHGLVYQSQQEIRRDRLLRRRDKLYSRLGGSPDKWPSRPKGMHRATWERYQDELEWLEAEMNAQFFRDMRWTG